LIVDYVLWGMIPGAKPRDRNEVNTRIVQNPARQSFDWLNSPIRVLP
jgi:hypothetical protein